jgi:uncharacterized UBP type Zn finger protein
MTAPCEHLVSVPNDPKPRQGCGPCLAKGDTWVHLRFCVACGAVGCCDESPNRHARAHAATPGHPVARSAEPDEMWAFCYPHDDGIEIEGPEIWA